MMNALDQWLAQISANQTQEIVLGLERVREVIKRLGWLKPSCPVIIVGGTNGKGSCVAALEKIYSIQGYRVGTFTSPILWRHNEMVRIQGEEVSDLFFCEAYAAIEKARQDMPLTPFEYHTLAALYIFQRHFLDLWILEVGLGGRLDAVNVLDADIALVTSIGLDHVEWLGDTRGLIGREKAGIFRTGRPAVCGDWEAPASLLQTAQAIGAHFYAQGKEFTYMIENNSWHWRGQQSSYSQLPMPILARQNISSSLMVIELLQSRLPVTEQAIVQGVKTVSLPGRIEIIPGPVRHIVDVAHNPAAVAFLAAHIKNLPKTRMRRAVFSMLGDKDLAGSIREIVEEIDEWFVAPLAVKRGASREKLEEAFAETGVKKVYFYDSVKEAYEEALSLSLAGDDIVVFGSFYVVGQILKR